MQPDYQFITYTFFAPGIAVKKSNLSPPPCRAQRIEWYQQGEVPEGKVQGCF